MSQRWFRPVFTAGLVGVLCGCVTSVGPRPATIAAAVELETGCRLTVDEHVELGGLRLAAVRALVRAAAAEPKAGAVLRHLKRVEVLELRPSPGRACGCAEAVGGLIGHLTADGWRQMIHERGDGASSWVLALPGGAGAVSGLYVIDADFGHLELVLVEGQIDRLLAETEVSDVGSVTRRIAGGG